MEDNELKLLEESAGIRRIVERSKVLMESEDRELRPKPFADLMREVERRRPSLSRFTFSAWRLAAACVVGILIGWCIPDGKPNKDPLLATVDTVVITERVVDTVYKEIPVVQKVYVTKSKETLSVDKQNDSLGLPVQSTDTTVTPLSENDLRRMDEEDSVLLKENFPFHLYVSL